MEVKTFFVFAAIMATMFMTSNIMNHKTGYLGGWADARRGLFEKESEFRLRAEKAIQNSPNAQNYKTIGVNPNMYGDIMNMVDVTLYEKSSGKHCSGKVMLGSKTFGDRLKIGGCYDPFDRDSKIARSP